MTEEIKIEHVTEFDLSRSIWLRGEGDHDSALLRERDEKMCCLGVYLKACGVPDDDLHGLGEPSHIDSSLHDDLPAWLFKPRWSNNETLSYASDDSSMLMSINDEEVADEERYEHLASLRPAILKEWHHRSEQERETKVIAFFKKNGITVNIVD